MGLFDQLGFANKFMAFLNPLNLQRLDRLFDVVVGEWNTTAAAVWKRFAERSPKPSTAGDFLATLRDLHALIKEYRHASR